MATPQHLGISPVRVVSGFGSKAVRAFVALLAAVLVAISISLPFQAQASHEELGQAVVSMDSSSGYSQQQFSLVLDEAGLIFGAGSNSNGQLGTGDTLSSATPRQVVNTGVLAGKTIIAVATGVLHSLALDVDGSVYSWGGNNLGQLGDGTTTQRNEPVEVDLSAVPEGRKIVKISAGAGHSAAIDDQGVVYTWGHNGNGQLGDGTTTQRTVPVSLATAGALAGLKVVDISLGGYVSFLYTGFSVAVTDTGVLVAWGANSDGELGDGTTTERTTPVLVDDSGALSGKSILTVSSGDRFTIVLDSQGFAYSWGANNWGQLGDGSTTRRISPVAVDVSGVLAGKQLVQVAAGSEFSMAIDSNGVLFAWGLNNYGQLGDNSLTNRSLPVVVDMSTALDGRNISSISLGYRSTLALDDSGLVHGWGLDSSGLLGTGLGNSVRAPILVVPAGDLTGKTIQATAFGYNHTLFIDSDGLVYAAGQNSSRQLGDGTTTDAASPIASGPTGGVLDEKTFTAVSAGIYHSLALDSTGKVYSWGANSRGQLGIGSTENADPTLVGGLISSKTIVAIAAGGYHSLALDNDGVLYSWGYNADGSLGVGDTINATSPVVVDMSGVLFGKTISTIHGGDRYSMVLDTAGNAYSWGDNSNGELGDNSQTRRTSPVAVYTAGDLSGKTITQLSPAMNHTVALDSDGSVYTWGYNGNAEIGDGSGSPRQVSPKLINLGDIVGKTITTIAAGWGYSLVLDDQGVAYAWGRNESGQLGLMDPSNKTTPTAVDASGALAGKALATLVTGFAGNASFATDTTGALFGWGRNQYSDLSIGDTSKYLVAKTTLFSGHIPAVAVETRPPVARPYVGPTNLSVERTVPANGTGVVTGSNLASIDAVFIANVKTDFEVSEDTSLTYAIPNLEPGTYTVKFYVAENQVYLIDYVEVVVGGSVDPVSQKVNAGSFKGYVALYAKGHEGKRLSAKIGKDWVIIPSIPAATNGLFRVVEYTGAGFDIAVKIYIDRVLQQTVNLTTR